MSFYSFVKKSAELGYEPRLGAQHAKTQQPTPEAEMAKAEQARKASEEDIKTQREEAQKEQARQQFLQAQKAKEAETEKKALQAQKTKDSVSPFGSTGAVGNTGSTIGASDVSPLNPQDSFSAEVNRVGRQEMPGVRGGGLASSMWGPERRFVTPFGQPNSEYKDSSTDARDLSDPKNPLSPEELAKREESIKGIPAQIQALEAAQAKSGPGGKKYFSEIDRLKRQYQAYQQETAPQEGEEEEQYYARQREALPRALQAAENAGATRVSEEARRAAMTPEQAQADKEQWANINEARATQKAPGATPQDVSAARTQEHLSGIFTPDQMRANRTNDPAAWQDFQDFSQKMRETFDDSKVRNDPRRLEGMAQTTEARGDKFVQRMPDGTMIRTPDEMTGKDPMDRTSLMGIHQYNKEHYSDPNNPNRLSDKGSEDMLAWGREYNKRYEAARGEKAPRTVADNQAWNKFVGKNVLPNNYAVRSATNKDPRTLQARMAADPVWQKNQEQWYKDHPESRPKATPEGEAQMQANRAARIYGEQQQAAGEAKAQTAQNVSATRAPKQPFKSAPAAQVSSANTPEAPPVAYNATAPKAIGTPEMVKATSPKQGNKPAPPPHIDGSMNSNGSAILSDTSLFDKIACEVILEQAKTAAEAIGTPQPPKPAVPTAAPTAPAPVAAPPAPAPVAPAATTQHQVAASAGAPKAAPLGESDDGKDFAPPVQGATAPTQTPPAEPAYKGWGQRGGYNPNYKPHFALKEILLGEQEAQLPQATQDWRSNAQTIQNKMISEAPQTQKPFADWDMHMRRDMIDQNTNTINRGKQSIDDTWKQVKDVQGQIGQSRADQINFNNEANARLDRANKTIDYAQNGVPRHLIQDPTMALPQQPQVTAQQGWSDLKKDIRPSVGELEAFERARGGGLGPMTGMGIDAGIDTYGRTSAPAHAAWRDKAINDPAERKAKQLSQQSLNNSRFNQIRSQMGEAPQQDTAGIELGMLQNQMQNREFDQQSSTGAQNAFINQGADGFNADNIDFY